MNAYGTSNPPWPESFETLCEHVFNHLKYATFAHRIYFIAALWEGIQNNDAA